MNRQFTPGPWIANDKHSGGYIWRIESDADGYPNDGYIIAKLDGPDAEANGRLIAAAPSLLVALIAMLENYGPPERVAALCEYPADHPITLARVAISKAVAE